MFPQPQLENIYYMEAIKLKDIIEKTLDVNKARDVVVIDLKRKTYIADYMIIALVLPQDIFNLYQKLLLEN